MDNTVFKATVVTVITITFMFLFYVMYLIIIDVEDKNHKYISESPRIIDNRFIGRAKPDSNDIVWTICRSVIDTTSDRGFHLMENGITIWNPHIAFPLQDTIAIQYVDNEPDTLKPLTLTGVKIIWSNGKKVDWDILTDEERRALIYQYGILVTGETVENYPEEKP